METLGLPVHAGEPPQDDTQHCESADRHRVHGGPLHPHLGRIGLELRRNGEVDPPPGQVDCWDAPSGHLPIQDADGWPRISRSDAHVLGLKIAVHYRRGERGARPLDLVPARLEMVLEREDRPEHVAIRFGEARVSEVATDAVASRPQMVQIPLGAGRRQRRGRLDARGLPMELPDPTRRQHPMLRVVRGEPLPADVLEKEPTRPVGLLERPVVDGRRDVNSGQYRLETQALHRPVLELATLGEYRRRAVSKDDSIDRCRTAGPNLDLLRIVTGGAQAPPCLHCGMGVDPLVEDHARCPAAHGMASGCRISAVACHRAVDLYGRAGSANPLDYWNGISSASMECATESQPKALSGVHIITHREGREETPNWRRASQPATRSDGQPSPADRRMGTLVTPSPPRSGTAGQGGPRVGAAGLLATQARRYTRNGR